LLAAGADVLAVIGTAVAGVLAAAVALADPAHVVLGGPWGSRVSDAVGAAFARFPRHVPVRPAAVADEASLAGARTHALQSLRDAIIATRA
jgi:hypothetical protein